MRVLWVGITGERAGISSEGRGEFSLEQVPIILFSPPEALQNARKVQCRKLVPCSIKKDTCTRLAGQQLEGAFVELDERATVLVTNTQSRHSSMPAPIEVELVHSDHLSMRQVVSQVVWLTRVCQGSANFPKRLPATTGWANNVAGTGHRVHLKGWEYCES